MFTEPELIVRRAGRDVRYLDAATNPLGDAHYASDRHESDQYVSHHDIRTVAQQRALTLWRVRQHASFTNPVLAKYVLCDELGGTIASLDVFKSTLVRCVVSVDGEQLGELKPRSRVTGRSFVVVDVEGREIASVNLVGFFSRKYRMTRAGSLPLVWQQATTVLGIVPILHPPNAGGG